MTIKNPNIPIGNLENYWKNFDASCGKKPIEPKKPSKIKEKRPFKCDISTSKNKS